MVREVLWVSPGSPTLRLLQDYIKQGRLPIHGDISIISNDILDLELSEEHSLKLNPEEE